MAVTLTKTNRDIVTEALRKASVLGWGENATPADAAAALSELNLMLKAWQNMGYNLWTTTYGNLTLTTAESYTLDPERPLQIISARFRESPNSSELIMQEMTREEYDDLPLKSATGTPTTFYYDRQRENAKLYIWPILASASGQTINYTYSREIEDAVDLDDEIDVPAEWWEAVIYNLAVRILETVPITNKPQTIFLRAEQTLRDAGAFDREGSLWFTGDAPCC